MKLRLKYNAHLFRHPQHATLLRGSDPAIWLREISDWHINTSELACFIIPVSIRSVEAGGLFIIFKNPANVKHIELLEPYTCVAKRLFIPCNTNLFPVINESELEKLLLFDLQVFHPATGLTGFDKNEHIHLQHLVDYSNQQKTDWSFAHPGIPAKPALEKIIVTPPSVDEIIDELKENIGQRPLEDIPVRENEKRTIVHKLLDGLKTFFFTGLLGVFSIFDKLLPVPVKRNTPTDQSGNSSKEGLLAQIGKWINKNLDDLQKKRNDELQRLLNLFEHDTNEALQFAIPLNSPYFNRGSQTASSRLSRNLPKFNLSRLGGGTVIDGWDLGNNYHELRAKYLKAAEQAIAKKDYKQAAYVYAHLLGDYYGAANVLEQGNLFREAAALNKDHLKNIPAAAKCLEKGGLYLEAIDLYKTLHQYEKIGDLYTILRQEDNASRYFENCIEARVEANDYLDAARVMHEKLQQSERAAKVLLQGWKSPYDYEPCLKKYFDIVHTEKNIPAADIVQAIYQSHTPANRKLPLLNILQYVNKKSGQENLLNTSREIAYEIVHEQAEKGNTAALSNLKMFLPGDQQIASDISRYNSDKSVRNSAAAMPQQLQLDKEVKWVKATWRRNQFFVIGIKNNHLQMARVNWYGNMEYYAWEAVIKPHTIFNFISAPYYSNQLILHSDADIPIARKNLPKNKYFNESLLVNCPIWMHKINAQFLVDNSNKICRLEIIQGNMTLHRYDLNGDLLNSVNCIFPAGNGKIGAVHSNPHLAIHNDYFYAYNGMMFFTISATGQSKATNLQTVIRTFSASEHMSECYLVISTNTGCCLCKPDKAELNFTGEFFAEKLIPFSIVFITAYRFVIAEKMKAFVFEIRDDKPQVIYEVATATTIAGVIPGGERDKFATVEEDGKIVVHDISGIFA